MFVSVDMTVFTTVYSCSLVFFAFFFIPVRQALIFTTNVQRLTLGLLRPHHWPQGFLLSRWKQSEMSHNYF